MEDPPAELDLLGDFFLTLQPDTPQADPDSPSDSEEEFGLAADEVFTERFQDYSSNTEHLARLDSEPFRDFLAGINSQAVDGEPDELSLDQIIGLLGDSPPSQDPTLGLLDGGGYAGDLLIIESNYRQALRLLETTTFFFLSIVITMVIVLMGIFVVIGLDWPVAVSIILVAVLFLYFASVAYRSVVAHSLEVARSQQIRSVVRVRRLARLNLAEQPTLLAWAQYLASRP